MILQVCSDDQRIWGTPLGDGVFEKPINALEKLFRSVRLGVSGFATLHTTLLSILHINSGCFCV